MPPVHRLPGSDSSAPRPGATPPFYRVDRREADGSTRHFVVHTRAPNFLVEFEGDPEGPAPGGGKREPTLRRVCIPNSWAGDYHHCARQLTAAAAFFVATEPSGA